MHGDIIVNVLDLYRYGFEANILGFFLFLLFFMEMFAGLHQGLLHHLLVATSEEGAIVGAFLVLVHHWSTLSKSKLLGWSCVAGRTWNCHLLLCVAGTC